MAQLKKQSQFILKACMLETPAILSFIFGLFKQSFLILNLNSWQK